MASIIKNDLTGKKFRDLTVIKYTKEKKKWLCRCICGNLTFVNATHLTRGVRRGCGCLLQSTHRLTKTPFWGAWAKMKARCNQPKRKDFFRYGGRGIKVCKRWQKFENFKKDMYLSFLKHKKDFPKEGTSLDRINNNGNYCKKNCRWATNFEQAINRSNNLMITHKGETKALAFWVKKFNLSYRLTRDRIKMFGWPLQRCINMKDMNVNKITPRPHYKKI